MKFPTNMVPLVLSAALLLLAGCRSASETIPGSDTIAVSPTKAATLPPPSPLAPSPISSSPLRLPQLEHRIETHYAANSYRGELLFAVDYDIAQWKYLTGDGGGPSLGHQEIPYCLLELTGGGDFETPGEEIGSARLAGRDWSIFRSESTERLYYRSAPYGLSAYVYPMGDPPVEGRLEMCQRAAEEVINSFRPISEYPAEYFEQSLGAIEPNTLDIEGWPTYTSERGGYSLRYPEGWTVEEGQKATVVITRPFGQRPDKIIVTYFDYEKPETDDLAAWAERVYEVGTFPPMSRTFSPVSLDVVDPEGASQQVHMQYPPSIAGEGYLISHGRLVLLVSTYDSFADWLLPVANSVAFAADAPTDQRELSFPDDLPTFTTLEALQQEEDDARLVNEALNYRLRTGSDPDHLLEGMSDYARGMYEQMLEIEAEVIAEVDGRREAPQSPLPTPTP